MKIKTKAIILWFLTAVASTSHAYFGESLWNKAVAFASQKNSNYKLSCLAAVAGLGIAAICCYHKYCAPKSTSRAPQCDPDLTSLDVPDDNQLRELKINTGTSGFQVRGDYYIRYHRHDYVTGFVYDLKRFDKEKLEIVFLARAPIMRFFGNKDCLVVLCANSDSIIYEAQVFHKDDWIIFPVIKEGFPKLRDIKSVSLIKKDGGLELSVIKENTY